MSSFNYAKYSVYSNEYQWEQIKRKKIENKRKYKKLSVNILDKP